MSSDVDGSVIVPSSSSVTRPSLPSTGSRWERFPCFVGTTDDSDSSRDRSASPQARRPTSIGRVFVCSGSSRHWARPSLGWMTATPRADDSDGDHEVSQVPGEPSCTCSDSLTPVGLDDQAFTTVEMSPSVIATTSAGARSPLRTPTFQRFRGSILQPAHSLSTLRRDGHPPPRKTRFRMGASRDRTGLEPAGLQMRFRE